MAGMAAWGSIGQPTASATGNPAMCANLAEFEYRTRSADGPARLKRVVQQPQQLGFGGRVDPGRDPTT